MNEQAGSERPVPLLRVVRGTPTPHELAALVAVVAARRDAAAAPPATTASEWASPARAVRVPLHPAADGWRRSGLPR